MQNMSESINENIPALLYALGEARNYSNLAPKTGLKHLFI